jgi:CDP-4-dehydro-6-deoxyglucose reductase, E1
MPSEAFLPLASTTWDGEEIDAIQRVIRSGKFTYGEEVLHFEKQAAQWFGSKYAVMVNSGSSANLLALSAVIWSRGITPNVNSEIIVTAVSWATTYFPITQLGFKIRLVDIDLDTLNAGSKQIADAINENTVGIFAVNLLGNPSDLDEIRKLADKHDLFFLEDNCESMGATLNNKQAGTFGDIGTFSTFFSHHISTMEGGFCTTDSKDLYEHLLSLRSHGWVRGLEAVNSVFNLTGSFQDSFLFALPGYNLRPIEFEGAIGQVQLRKLDQFIKVRRQNAQSFVEIFGQIPGIRIQKETGESSWFGFAVILDTENREVRDGVASLLRSRGIETRPIVAGNILRHPVAPKLNMAYGDSPLVNADKVHDSGFFLGNHHFPIESKFQMIADCIITEISKK